MALISRIRALSATAWEESETRDIGWFKIPDSALAVKALQVRKMEMAIV
jgi:hypothetical protein